MFSKPVAAAVCLCAAVASALRAGVTPSLASTKVRAAAVAEETTSKLPATVKPGVVTGQALVDLLAYAKDTGFAIPAVNAVSSCGINACLEAAAKFKGPMIVQFSRGAWRD